jgi:hypothetical protein
MKRLAFTVKIEIAGHGCAHFTGVKYITIHRLTEFQGARASWDARILELTKLTTVLPSAEFRQTLMDKN